MPENGNPMFDVLTVWMGLAILTDKTLSEGELHTMADNFLLAPGATKEQFVEMLQTVDEKLRSTDDPARQMVMYLSAVDECAAFFTQQEQELDRDTVQAGRTKFVVHLIEIAASDGITAEEIVMIKSTANRLGLEVDIEVDEATNMIHPTVAELKR